MNWNRLADVRLALDYLRKIHYEPTEVIVVDNGSTDGSVEELGRYPGITFVAHGKNDGPCVARNIGLRAAKGPYVFFLDSDALLGKNALNVLVPQLESDTSIGLIGCRIDNYHKRRIDQWIYAQDFERRTHQRFETYSFSAAGALARKDLLLAVGGFSERLAIYNEEVDLSIRLVQAGKKVMYDSASRVLHRPAVTGRAPGRDYWRLQLRNWIWIFFRYYPGLQAWRRALLYTGLYFVKATANKQLRAWVAGVHEGFAGRHAEPGTKLTPAQVEHYDSLNRRKKLVLGRG